MKDLDSLEGHLRARLSDSRAMTATLDINNLRVLLHFGQIGPLKAISFRIVGDEVQVVAPDDLAHAWQRAEADKRRTQAQASAGPISAVVDGENLRTADGAPITLPDGFAVVPEDELRALIAEADAASKGAEAGQTGEGAGAAATPANDTSSAAVGAQPVKAINPDDFTKAELAARAKAAGIATGGGMTKADLAAALNAKRGEAVPNG